MGICNKEFVIEMLIQFLESRTDLEGEGGLEGERGQFRDSCLQWGLQIRADYFMNWLQMTG